MSLTSNFYMGDAYLTKDIPDVRSVGTELREINEAEFERCWPAMVIDLLIMDDVSIPEMAKLLTLVRNRYRASAGGARRKYCPRCHEVKGPAQFYHNASRPDGLAAECKMCDRARKVAHA